MTKVLAVCGSPRKGNTEFLLKELLKSAEKNGADTELILLRKYNINHCIGCDGDKCHPGCIQNDDMKKIYPKIEGADIIVLGTPVYFFTVSGLMKDFMDRCRRVNLKGKLGAMVIVAGNAGISLTWAVLADFLLFRGAILEGYNVVEAHAYKAGEAEKNKNALKDARELGKRLALSK